ncbi:hypothetical protein [Caldovatus aquaticus]|uniref:Rhamnan synthesis protein F n=1 Tax=Caldovatus aquaticus TaxID=2865671 RepID=A0ABS7F0S7_9PROT|nr:hypothetical protein [Caldovatus aquaticus]MBW8268567.1 hypothetical protein [Caldovatus aquaticus]
MAEPILTDLAEAEPGLRRCLHGLPDLPRLHQGPQLAKKAGRLAVRVAERLGEVARAAVRDPVMRLRSRPEALLRVEAGERSDPARRSVALFVHFSPDGRVSSMVRRQLETYDRLGFETVFISNAPAVVECDWQAARARVALAVHRRNFGLDFGAWKDVAPLALARWPQAEELLLVNDSVLGPIRPLDPVLAAMRTAGPGLFGLLESVQGGPHLQSWFVLARGRALVADVAAFLAALRLSVSKWLVVQRGELRLARAMRQRGHRVAAVYSYAALLERALSDPAERAYLIEALPSLERYAALPEAEAVAALRARLLARPLNPAHHLWRVLYGPAGCPFVKTELVRRNPGRLPGVEAWRALVPPDSPCPLPEIEAHLRLMGGAPAR